MRYVLGDLHGNHRALLEVLGKARFNFDSDTLIFIGDLADGYPDPDLCLTTLLRIKNLVPIWGNHDIWLHNWLIGKTNYLYRSIIDPMTLVKMHPLKEELKTYFGLCKHYHIEDSMIFLHGGFNHKKPIREQKPKTFSLNRRLYEVARKYHRQNLKIIPPIDGSTPPISEIFIGHTPTFTHKPDFASNLINIDTGGGNGGKLTLMDIDSKNYWQSNYGKKLYKVEEKKSVQKKDTRHRYLPRGSKTQRQ